MKNDSMDTLRFIIHRNFCSQYDSGEVLGARDEGESGASAFVDMPPERLKVYLEEYSEELTFPIEVEGKQSGAKIAMKSGKNTRELLKFVAKLPLKGESADAVRSLTETLSKEDLGVTLSPESLELTKEGLSLMLEAPGSMDAEQLLDDLRRVITPKGFAVDVCKL